MKVQNMLQLLPHLYPNLDDRNRPVRHQFLREYREANEYSDSLGSSADFDLLLHYDPELVLQRAHLYVQCLQTGTEVGIGI